MPQDRGSQSLRFRRSGLINRFGYLESNEGRKREEFGRFWSTRRKWFAFWAGKAWRRRLPSTGSMLCHGQHTCLLSRRHHWLTKTAFCCVEARNRHRNYLFRVPHKAPAVALPFWHPISQSRLRSFVQSFETVRDLASLLDNLIQSYLSIEFQIDATRCDLQ